MQIREAVAAATGVRCVKAWHPGKPAAIEFVSKAGFPRELAGVPTPDRPPDYEYLEGRFKLKELERFQTEVKQRLDATINRPGERAILTLPTGAGKTRVAVESIRDWLTAQYDIELQKAEGAMVLWLAHTEELCEQAYACFQQIWEGSDNVCPLLLV